MPILKIKKNHFNENEFAEELYLSEKEIKDLASKNLIGNHTHNHKIHGNIDAKEIMYKINESQNFLKEIKNTSINAITYPFGAKEVFPKKSNWYYKENS